MVKQDTSYIGKEASQLDAYQAAKRIQIGRFFDGARRDKGWSQTKLAKAAGCTQSMVSKICTGQVMPSSDLQSGLLEALGLPLDSIDKLPGLGFTPGSQGFQLKILIIRALVAGEIPTDDVKNAREFVEDDWDHPAYRELSRTRNLDDAVWSSLVADHYFEVDEEGRYRPLPIYYDLKGNLLLYIAAMASGMSTVRNLPPQMRPRAIASFDKALKAWRESIDQPDKMVMAIEACSYSLAAGDRMMLAALLGHASALKFFLEVGVSVVSGKEEHYANIIKPFFVAILESLQLARDRMVADNSDPTRDLIASLSQRVDEIFTYWRSCGMISDKSELPSANEENTE